MPEDFMDFISDEEMQEILDIEAELGVDINIDEILSEVDEYNGEEYAD